MQDDVHIVITLGTIGLCTAVLMTNWGWDLLKSFFKFAVFSIKWAVIVGFTWAFLNMPAMYNVIGFTPMSVLIGNELYQRREDTSGPQVKTTNKAIIDVKEKPKKLRRAPQAIASK